MRIRRRRLRDALVAVGCLVATVDPFGAPAGRALFAAAVALLVAGSLLHFWSKGCLEQNQRLVTAGPYRFTRNPFYLANGLIDLGLCCLIGRIWVAVPFAVLWGLAYHETIRREEERLAALFPDAFERYVAAVPRLIPTGRSLPREAAVGGFRLANPALAQGSEYGRIVGVWVAAATIVAWDWIRAQGLSIFAPEQTLGLGLVALVGVAWVAKLAVGEVFRRPETSLLPMAADPSRRRPLTFLLVLAIWFLASSPGFEALRAAASPSEVGSVAFGIALVVLLALPVVRDRPGPRALFHAVLAAAVGVFAADRGVLWLAGGTILWIVLAALDDTALARGPRGEGTRAVPPGARALWPAFRPIAILTPLSLIALVVMKKLV